MGASSLSHFSEQRLLHHKLGIATYPFPTQVFVALYTATPGKAPGSGTEVILNSGANVNYARVRAYFGSAPIGSGFSNIATDVNFATAGAGGWATIVAMGLHSAAASAADDYLAFSGLATVQTVLVNQRFVFSQGADLSDSLH